MTTTPPAHVPEPERPTTPSARRKRRIWPWVAAVGALVGVVIAIRIYGARESAERSARGRDTDRAVPVAIAEARVGDVPVYLRGLGTVTPSKTATIRSRVDGQLLRVEFKEGEEVREGALLAQIDPRPFQVLVDQAEGQLARDQATLKDAQVNLTRLQDLFEQQIVSKQQLDTQRAQVDQAAGVIKSDEAQVASARLQLSYTMIRAPFEGRVGLRLVDPGNMVRAGDTTGLLVLTQVHPITVVFSLPQDDLGAVLDKLKASPPLPVEAFDRDNTKLIANGKLLTIDNQIDPATGTYKLKAEFENMDDKLFPNQFVNARLQLDTRSGLLLVPSVAIQHGPDGTFVYVVDEKRTAHMRPVRVALSEGADAATDSGLVAGDDVVVDGQDKLKEGSKVEQPGQDDGAGKKDGAPAADASKRRGGGKSKGRKQ